MTTRKKVEKALVSLRDRKRGAPRAQDIASRVAFGYSMVASGEDDDAGGGENAGAPAPTDEVPA